MCKQGDLLDFAKYTQTLWTEITVGIHKYLLNTCLTIIESGKHKYTGHAFVDSTVLHCSTRDFSTPD